MKISMDFIKADLKMLFGANPLSRNHPQVGMVRASRLQDHDLEYQLISPLNNRME